MQCTCYNKLCKKAGSGRAVRLKNSCGVLTRTDKIALMRCAQGYAPISIRLVEAALKGGWGPVAEVLSMMPGGQFDSLQVRIER